MKNKDRALLVAEKAHANQSYDIYPYMYHIKMVVEIAQELGFDEDIQIACTLHDVLEDSDLSFNDIKKNFGEMIAQIVYDVTDELGKNRKERKRNTYPKIRSNWRACVVKICDRIANIRHSSDYNREKFEMYKDESAAFERALRCKDEDMSEIQIKAWQLLKDSTRML